MGSQEDVTMLIGAMDSDPTDRVDPPYKQLIVKKVIHFIGLFYLVYGVFIAYAWTSKELDVKSRDNVVARCFWGTALTVYCASKAAVFAMIMLNKYWSQRANERRIIHKPDNFIVACIMLVPLFVSSSIYNIIKLARDIAIIPCHGYTEVLDPVTTLALLTGTAVIIFDVGYFTSPSTQWKKEAMKRSILFFTIIGLINCLIINIAMQHMEIFRKESLNSSYGHQFVANETCISNKKIGSSINHIVNVADRFLRPTYILFLICSLAYLAQPQQQSTDPTINYKQEGTFSTSDRETAMSEDSFIHEEQLGSCNKYEVLKVSYRLPAMSLVLCISALSFCFLCFVIRYSCKQTRPNEKAQKLKNMGSIIYLFFLSIVYVIGIGISLIHIREIGRWEMLLTRKGKIIDKYVVWTGAGGQLAVAMTVISKSAIMLGNGSKGALSTALLCTFFIKSFLLIIQTILQTIQMSLLLERKWIRPEIDSWANKLCPAVGMMGLNIGLMILSVDSLKSPILTERSGEMFIDLFVSELNGIGETLCILQRLHGSLLFASMIVYTHY